MSHFFFETPICFYVLLNEPVYSEISSTGIETWSTDLGKLDLTLKFQLDMNLLRCYFEEKPPGIFNGNQFSISEVTINMAVTKNFFVVFMKYNLPSLPSLLAPLLPRTQKNFLDGFGRFEFEGGQKKSTTFIDSDATHQFSIDFQGNCVYFTAIST